MNLFFQPNVSQHLAVMTGRHYWNLVDYEVYGENQAKRRGKRLPRACFLERSLRNYHYHCIVQLPEVVRNRDLFCLGLRAYWANLPLAGKYGRFEQVETQDNWSHYITKGERFGKDTYCTFTSHF